MKSAAELVDPLARQRHVEHALQAFRAERDRAAVSEQLGQNDGVHGQDAGDQNNLDAWFDNALWK